MAYLQICVLNFFYISAAFVPETSLRIICNYESPIYAPTITPNHIVGMLWDTIGSMF